MVVFLGPIKQKRSSMGKEMSIEVNHGNIEVKYVFFLAKKVVIYAIFWGKTFSRHKCPCKVCAKFHVCLLLGFVFH